MTPSAIRCEPEEKAWITAFAEMNGITFSAQIRQWALERLEDEMDARDLKATAQFWHSGQKAKKDACHYTKTFLKVD